MFLHNSQYIIFPIMNLPTAFILEMTFKQQNVSNGKVHIFLYD